MIKEAIEKVLSLAPPIVLSIGSRPYADKTIHPILEPLVKVLNIDTLTGFVDYLEANVDLLDSKKLLIHVQNYGLVSLISSLEEKWKERDYFITAKCDTFKFPFGQFMDVESFIIRMQAQFVQDECTAEILKIVGNVSDGVVRNFKDDGVTQEITAKKGVSRVENIPVPNPVILAPYRTFLEIEQPESRFVFRMRAGEGAPTCALFEADGGTWKNVAVLRIKEWLSGKVKGIPIIA